MTDDTTERSPQGFAQIPRWVQQSETISAAAKLVYLALSSRANRYAQSTPSHRLLAQEASCSIATVKRALLELQALDLVSWEDRYRPGDEGRTSNVYTVSVGQRPGSHGATPSSSLSDPLAQGERPPRSQGATKNETQKNETQKNEEELLSDASGVLVVVTPEVDVDAEFEAFWKIYPRRVAKKPAADAYRRARKAGTPAAVIAAGATRYAAEVAGRQPEHIAHPTTWLRAERWTDETPAARTAAQQPARRLSNAEQALALVQAMSNPQTPAALAAAPEGAPDGPDADWSAVGRRV